MNQLINQVLRDRYQIQSLLSRQPGRRTSLAVDLQTRSSIVIKRSSVVIKLLLFNSDFPWDDLKLSKREAETLKSLDHPAIPKYLDCFEVETEIGKGFALVQTYIEARSLQDWIQSGRTFSEDDLKAIAKELLDILEYLHNRQSPVVHRDIKPSNILLGERSGNSPGLVYLVNFGSVQTAVHSRTRAVVGTYGYSPPEQFVGQATPASDLYALGATLIYLATGQHPDSLPQQELRTLSEDRVNLSPSLIDWLRWITEPSLELRLKFAKQALEALEKESLRERPAAIHSKPVGSKIKVTNTREMLEILIPSRGFHSSLIPTILLMIVWNFFLMLWYVAALATWSSGGWFLALFAMGHLYAGLYLTWSIFFTLFGKVKLRITQSKISLSSEILGLRCLPPLTASRQIIEKIELTQFSYKGDLGGYFAVPPQINILAGTKRFSLGSKNSWQDYSLTLTAPELDWLAQELSSWLDLPITQDY